MLRPLNTAELHFQLEHEIGTQGRNSQVFTALDLQLNSTLAIKRVAKNMFGNIAEYFGEASLLHLSAHPNIVPVHYACQDQDYIYLAMPHYVSGSLKTRMNQGHLTVREVITYIAQISSGLHNIHSKRLIHFDIKPDNVLLSHRGEALISDFGLAKQISFSGVAAQDRFYGKMAPPEAYRGGVFTRSFDIYQLGLTMHRMCVGDPVFYGNYNQYIVNGSLDRLRFCHAVLNGQFPMKGQYLEHIPQCVINVIRDCLNPDPAQRPISTLDVVNAISSVEEDLLDWKYEENNGARSWVKCAGNQTVRMTLDIHGNSLATKTNSGGQTKRVTKYCVHGITRQLIKSFLRGSP